MLIDLACVDGLPDVIFGVTLSVEVHSHDDDEVVVSRGELSNNDDDDDPCPMRGTTGANADAVVASMAIRPMPLM